MRYPNGHDVNGYPDVDDDNDTPDTNNDPDMNIGLDVIGYNREECLVSPLIIN